MSTLHDTRHHIGWIDYAKSLLIYLVVLYHCQSNGVLSDFLNMIMIPGFFFVSGFLFSKERNPSFAPFARKRFRQLIVPYLWINVIAYIAWYFVLRHFGDSPGDTLQWHEPLVAVALGIPPMLAHDIPLWSLVCFFVVEILYYTIHEFLKVSDLVIAIISYGLASLLSLEAGHEGLALPLALAPAAAGLTFYSIGHFVKCNRHTLDMIFRPSMIVVIAGVVLMAVAYLFNMPTSFYISRFENPLWFICGATGGILLVIQLSTGLDHLLHDRPLVRFISHGTLLICGFHLLVFAFIKGAMLFLLGVEPAALTDGIARSIVFSTVSTLLCLPIIWIVERKMRFLVDK